MDGPCRRLSGGQKLHFCIAVFHKNCNILRTVYQSKLNICNRSNFTMLNQKLMVERQWQRSNGVLRKRCSKNMQQICRRTSLLKPPFDMGVLLLICCIFSEHPFIRTPMEGCFWKDMNVKENHVICVFLSDLPIPKTVRNCQLLMQF